MCLHYHLSTNYKTADIQQAIYKGTWSSIVPPVDWNRNVREDMTLAWCYTQTEVLCYKSSRASIPGWEVTRQQGWTPRMFRVFSFLHQLLLFQIRFRPFRHRASTAKTPGTPQSRKLGHIEYLKSAYWNLHWRLHLNLAGETYFVLSDLHT